MSTIAADYTNLAIKGLQPIFKLALQTNLEQYKANPFIKFYNTSEWSEIFSSTEGLSGFRKLVEEETPDVVSLNQGLNITLSAERQGLGMVVSQDTMVKAGDDTTKIDAYLMEQRNQLLKTATKAIMDDAFYAYNHAFDTDSTINAPDGLELCATHVYKSGDTFTNKKTGALSETTMNTADEYAGDFKDQAGKEMPLTWTAIMVKKGSAAARMAIKMFASSINPTSVDDINIYAGSLKVVETPFISTTNKLNFFFMDENILPNGSPVVCGMVQVPTFGDPIKLANESIRSNVTGYWKVGITNLPLSILGFTGV